MDNSKIKALWKSFGGGQHGPHIETMTIPESGFYAFCQAALAAAEERGRVTEREECAKVADAHIEMSLGGDFWKGINTASREIARTILARAQKEPS